MLIQIALGCLMMIATTAVHAICTMAAVSGYRRLHGASWSGFSRSTKIAVLAVLVLLFFLASLLEIWLWALLYNSLGLLSDVEVALYFSSVTYTTLGFGDITPQHWLGEIIVIIEVVLGYMTLGLLLTILANNVARRS